MKLRSKKIVNRPHSKKVIGKNKSKKQLKKSKTTGLQFDFGKVKTSQPSPPSTPSSPTTPSSLPSPPRTPSHPTSPNHQFSAPNSPTSPPTKAPKINLREKAAPKGSLPKTKKASLNEYLDLDNPVAYSGNVSKKLKTIESVSRHKRRLKKFRRRKVYVGGPYTQIQADLIHYRGYARQNNGYKYILAVIDCFSRKNYCRPMKTATAAETAKNLDDIFSSMKYTPTRFASDNGNEFHVKNPEIFKVLVEKYGMVVFTLKAPLKASMVERFIRTLKERFERYFTENKTFRWIDVLDKLSNAINNSVNRSIGMAPNDVNFDNQEEVFNRLYGSQAPPILCKYKVGDIVRIPENKKEFAKGYKPNWSRELYKIRKILSDRRVCYFKLKTISGHRLDKSFYEQELNFVARNAAN